MGPHPDGFRGYLDSIPDDLLIDVAEDYVWLRSVFRGDPQGAEFGRRNECCQNECRRRGLPAMFEEAETHRNACPA